MKRLSIALIIILLAGTSDAWAQGGSFPRNSNSGRQGSSLQNNARKANTSQTMGNGVPYNKDAEQKRAIAKGSTSTNGGPTVNRSQSASASAPATAKGKNMAGSKSSQKTGNQ
ncbi:hypothetical protein [Spirosoma aerophilum]